MARMTLWTSMNTALAMGPDYIKSLGYTDVLVNRGMLPELGGAGSGMPEAWETDWCADMHAHGLRVFNLRYTQRRVQATGTRVQPHDYFDNAWWDAYVAPNGPMERWGQRIMAAGYDGIGTDTEDSMGWQWHYNEPGATPDTHSVAERNYLAAIRGRQTADAFHRGFPGAEHISYNFTFPRGHRHWVMHREYGIEWGNDDAWTDLQTFWWRGWIGCPNMGQLHLANPLFYKVGHHNPPAPYSTTANSGEAEYWANRYALDRDGGRAYMTAIGIAPAQMAKVHTPPMIAISPIEGGNGVHFEAKPVAHVKQQVIEAARAAELDGGLFVDYHHGGHPWVYPTTEAYPGLPHPTLAGTTFSYDPYKADMLAASAFELNSGTTGAVTFPVTVSGQTTSGLLTVNLP
jgi:hypothetical protein